MRESGNSSAKGNASNNKNNASGPGHLAKRSLSRRSFLQTSAVVAGAAVAASCTYVPSRVVRGQGPGGRIRVGQIGAGRIATQHDMPGVFKAGGADAPLADYVAICDLDSKRVAIGKTYMESQYKTRTTPMPDIKVFTKYEELLASPDIDAVVISLPDHQHAQICLAAIRAG